VKLTKTTWIAIAVGAVIIGGVSLFMVLNQQTTQKADLEKKLVLAQQKMALADNEKMIAQRDQLNSQVSESAAQVEKYKAQLTYPDDNIDITKSVIKNAVDCHVDLIDLHSSGQNMEKLGGQKYQAMEMSLRVQGTTQTISDFIYSLKKVFPTCVITSASLDFTNPPAVISESDNGTSEILLASDNNTTGANLKDTVVSLSFIVYNYAGE
jgi:hypothetical protein